MTAEIDGRPWVPVFTAAYGTVPSVDLWASDCAYSLRINIRRRFNGPGTYEVVRGDVDVDLRCDGPFCGVWTAGASTDPGGTTTATGSGSITVTAFTAPTPGQAEGASGAIEGTFAFTLDPVTFPAGATGTKVISNGRFGANFPG